MSQDKNHFSNDSNSEGKETINRNKPDNSDKRSDDPLNKYSFSSYHMNIISGNNHVQTLPTGQNYQMQNGDYMSYYNQPQFQPQNPYIGHDIQMLINNMFSVLNNQSKLLSYLIEKNDHNFFTTNKIYDELKTIKKQEVPELQSFDKHFKKPSYSSDITSNDLVSILYGQKTTFKYKLVVDSKVPFQTPLYRERNFKLKINLIDENGKIFSNSNRIPISLALYTVENPPKFLESNTLGNKMLKGYSEQDLFNGVCLFQKIQIKEVTSHYRKNMLFLVAFAKVPSIGAAQDDNYLDYQQIMPLVIDKVVVKAKKMKKEESLKGDVQKAEPEQLQDVDEIQEDEEAINETKQKPIIAKIVIQNLSEIKKQKLSKKQQKQDEQEQKQREQSSESDKMFLQYESEQALQSPVETPEK